MKSQCQDRQYRITKIWDSTLKTIWQRFSPNWNWHTDIILCCYLCSLGDEYSRSKFLLPIVWYQAFSLRVSLQKDVLDWNTRAPSFSIFVFFQLSVLLLWYSFCGSVRHSILLLGSSPSSVLAEFSHNHYHCSPYFYFLISNSPSIEALWIQSCKHQCG